MWRLRQKKFLVMCVPWKPMKMLCKWERNERWLNVWQTTHMLKLQAQDKAFFAQIMLLSWAHVNPIHVAKVWHWRIVKPESRGKKNAKLTEFFPLKTHQYSVIFRRRTKPNSFYCLVSLIWLLLSTNLHWNLNSRLPHKCSDTFLQKKKGTLELAREGKAIKKPTLQKNPEEKNMWIHVYGCTLQYACTILFPKRKPQKDF